MNNREISRNIDSLLAKFNDHPDELLGCFYPFDLKIGFNQSSGPKFREYYESARYFILGHFTSSIFLDSILNNGLIPDSEKDREMDDRIPSDRTSVYLLTCKDVYYFDRAENYHGGKGIYVQVVVAKERLLADEEKLYGRTGDPNELLYLSMCGGSCKHDGAIPKDQILEVGFRNGTTIYRSPRKYFDCAGRPISSQ